MSTVARLTLRDWANERFDGKLDEQLAQWREEGLTLDAIVDELREQYALPASRETVRRWIQVAAA